MYIASFDEFPSLSGFCYMSNADVYLSVIVGGVFIGGCVMVPKLIEDVVSFIKYLRFTKDLRSAILFCQPSWPQVCDLAKAAGLTDRSAYNIALSIRHSIMTGGEGKDGVADHRALVDSWIEEYRRAEPFEGLPDAMRVSLERLRADLGTNTDALQNITSSIREMVKNHSFENKVVKWVTYAGLPIGVGGVAFTVWSYLHPLASGA